MKYRKCSYKSASCFWHFWIQSYLSRPFHNYSEFESCLFLMNFAHSNTQYLVYCSASVWIISQTLVINIPCLILIYLTSFMYLITLFQKIVLLVKPWVFVFFSSSLYHVSQLLSLLWFSLNSYICFFLLVFGMHYVAHSAISFGIRIWLEIIFILECLYRFF